MLGAFAVCALAIAGVGLFGVLSYGVAQRVREIGVRTALGAQPRDIVTLVLRQAMLMAGLGRGGRTRRRRRGRPRAVGVSLRRDHRRRGQLC